MGRWLVQGKGANLKTGRCGLKYHEKEGLFDLGFGFLKPEWNNGYATEAGEGCIDSAKNKGIKTVVGRAMKEEKSSIQVLTKLGFTHWKDVENELRGGI